MILTNHEANEDYSLF